MFSPFSPSSTYWFSFFPQLQSRYSEGEVSHRFAVTNFYTYDFYLNILDFQDYNAKENKCQGNEHYL